MTRIMSAIVEPGIRAAFDSNRPPVKTMHTPENEARAQEQIRRINGLPPQDSNLDIRHRNRSNFIVYGPDPGKI